MFCQIPLYGPSVSVGFPFRGARPLRRTPMIVFILAAFYMWEEASVVSPVLVSIPDSPLQYSPRQSAFSEFCDVTKELFTHLGFNADTWLAFMHGMYVSALDAALETVVRRDYPDEFDDLRAGDYIIFTGEQ